jgi:hypothetical protein
LDEPGDRREEGKRKGQKPTILPTSERGKNAHHCPQKLGRYKKLAIVPAVVILEVSCQMKLWMRKPLLKKAA